MFKQPPEGQGENTNRKDKIQTHANMPCHTKWTAQTGLRLPLKKNLLPKYQYQSLFDMGRKKKINEKQFISTANIEY